MGRDRCTSNCNICRKSPNKCDDTFISIIDKGKCGNYCSECSQSCLICDGVFKEIDTRPKYNINFSQFKPYFDVTLGKEVTSKREIDEYCKSNNMIYAGDKELTQQCKQNKKENEIKLKNNFREGLAKELGKVL